MAHGLNSELKRGVTTVQSCNKGEGKTGIGSRRIFSPYFKLQVLDSYRNDPDCKGNQRATARKYGIHRRQIQKWLQVENTLRNSVSKVPAECKVEVPEARKCGMEVALSNGRQRDDLKCVAFDAYPACSGSGSSNSSIGSIGSGVPDLSTRVPAISPSVDSGGCCSNTVPPAPLDFTTHSRGHGSPLVASPDRCPPSPAPMDLSLKRPAPVPLPPFSPSPLVQLQPLLVVPSPPSLSQPHPDVWDLSTRRATSVAPKRKLDDDTQTSPKPPVKLFKPYLDDVKPVKHESVSPPCCVPHPNYESYYYNNNNNSLNNNNYVCDIKSEYVLTELHPKAAHTYYYPFASGVYTPPDYEIAPYAAVYEESSYIAHPQAPLKQRQSYSLDFKLQAIDSYYEDTACKGNQRAVASKYNVHRRQVQKWLKQEDELRHRRNESLHAVR